MSSPQPDSEAEIRKILRSYADAGTYVEDENVKAIQQMLARAWKDGYDKGWKARKPLVKNGDSSDGDTRQTKTSMDS